MSCLTRNTNIRANDDIGGDPTKKHRKGASVGTGDGKNSLFEKVLKRRKSRQSTFAPGVIDFDYAGNSADYQHLINKRSDMGFPNKTQLNFEMKLRNYKNSSEFYAGRHWCFPSVKVFSPKKQWAQRKGDVNLLNAEYKRKFKDQFAQKNAGELQHMFDKQGMI